MKFISHVCHAIRELGRIRLKGSIWRSSGRPAVVQNDISIAKIPEAIINNLLGRS